MNKTEKRTLDFRQKHEEDLQRLKQFCLLDDDFMSKVFEDKECTELLLRIILNRTDLQVQSVHGQHVLKNLQGRSVRLDILATDMTGRVHNIEIQRDNKGAEAKRARYNSSLMDANVIEPGEKYENLRETYVIFITENDVLKAGLPIYHIDRVIKENGRLFEDGAHIIYVNAQMQDETALGKLMHDFTCTRPEDMKYKILANRVRYFKEDEKGVDDMSQILEDMRKDERIEIAARLIKMGKLSKEEIARAADLSVQEVVELEKSIS